MSDFRSRALAALELVPRVCGLASNAATRAWMVANAVRKGDAYGAQRELAEMKVDYQHDYDATPPGHRDIIIAAAVDVGAWIEWMGEGRHIACSICARSDLNQPLDGGVCVACRRAASEAGVAGKVLASSEPKDEMEFEPDPDEDSDPTDDEEDLTW